MKAENKFSDLEDGELLTREELRDIVLDEMKRRNEPRIQVKMKNGRLAWFSQKDLDRLVAERLIDPPITRSSP